MSIIGESGSGVHDRDMPVGFALGFLLLLHATDAAGTVPEVLTRGRQRLGIPADERLERLRQTLK